MQPEIILLSPDDVAAHPSQILGVCRAAFGAPPWNETEEDFRRFKQRLAYHSQLSGFRCRVAREADPARTVGFSYGYTSAPDQLWHRLVTRQLDGKAIERWFSNAFELAELAVMPSSQGQGIGVRLHDALLTDLPHRTAVCSTLQEENAALGFFLKRGWVPVREGFLYPRGSRRYVILGLDLSIRS